MNKWTKIFPVLVLFSTIMTGCDSNETGRTAVIDLDKIAQAVGRDKMMSDKVATFIKEKEAAVTKLRDEFKSNLDAEKKKLGKNPTTTAKNKYNQLSFQYEQKLRQDLSQAEQEANQLRIKLVQEFREEIQPEAAIIAARKGFSLVFIKQAAMIYMEPSVDISKDIIAALSASDAAAK